MIDSIRLFSGRSRGTPGETLPNTPVTVFVGPNNSGKSTALREIARRCSHPAGGPTNYSIVGEVTFAASPNIVAERLLEQMISPGGPIRQVPDGRLVAEMNSASREQVLSAIQNPQASPALFANFILKHKTVSLDGMSRMGLVQKQPVGVLQEPPTTTFQRLLRDSSMRREVRSIIFDAFGQYLVLDLTREGGQVKLALSDRAPNDDAEECGMHEGAIAFHRTSSPIESGSDGVKAYVGMITHLVAGNPLVTLIDEPEAFLHPPLALKLGQHLATSVQRSGGRVFAATHSPAFLMGCVQSGVPVTIVRLTYQAGFATARVLPSDQLVRLMRNPLLRSVGVLDGLFHEFVVVTEADADRAFYEEVNQRLLRDPVRRRNAIPGALFLNAQNKQTERMIVQPLRELGIPTAGIVDIDIVKEGGKVWTDLLTAFGVPPLSQNPWGQLRASINQKFEAIGRNMKTQGGISLLANPDQEAALGLIRSLEGYGLFVVSGGELESWLPNLNVPRGHKSSWLIKTFESMGEDPAVAPYVPAADDDVWAFMSGVSRWLLNPGRQGLPS